LVIKNKEQYVYGSLLYSLLKRIDGTTHHDQLYIRSWLRTNVGV